MLSKKDPRRITLDKEEIATQTIKPISEKVFSRLEHDVFTYWPTAKHLPKDLKTLSVFNHAEKLIWKNPIQETDIRREQFREHLRDKVKTLLGEEIAESVYVQLATNHSMATGPHATPLSPKSLNPLLEMALSYLDRKEKDRQNIIALTCSGISFNNHWYPRGHLFHSLVGDTIVENQLNFFGRSVDADPVVTQKAYESSLKTTLIKTILHLRSEKQIKKRELNKITELLTDVFFSPKVLAQKYYVDQLALTNFELWKRAFAEYPGNVPNLIFLSQEKIAADLLQKFHMNTNTELGQVLFNKDWHTLIYKYFENIQCAFSVARQYGTFLFWATPKNTTNRLQLFAKDGVLESINGLIKIPMTPESINKALIEEEITPSTMLTFLVLSLYYGYSLIGGLDQPTYLTQTKAAYLNLLKELGMEKEISYYEPIPTEDITLTRPTLAFLDGPHETRVHASMLDLLLHGNKQSIPTVVEAAKQVTEQDILYRLYPEIYRDYCEKDNKEQELLEVTERDVEHHTGLDKKIPPLAVLTNT